MFVWMRTLKWMAPDDAGSGASATAAPPVEPTSEEEAGEGAAAEEEPDSKEPAKPEEADDAKGADEQEPVKLNQKQSRELARLKGVLADRQKEIATLKEAGTGKVDTPPAGQKPDAGTAGEHPALRGLTETDDGTGVIVDGYEIPKSLVIDQYESKQALDEIRRGQQSEEVSRAEARLSAAYDELQAEVDSAITERADKLFAHYEPNDRAKAGSWLAADLDGILDRVFRAGADPSPETIENAINEALELTRLRSAMAAKYQQAGNAAHSAAHKVKPDGTPGVAGAKPVSEMSKQERRRYDAEVWKQAEARAAKE